MSIHLWSRLSIFVGKEPEGDLWLHKYKTRALIFLGEK